MTDSRFEKLVRALALLLPTLARAKEQAKCAMCISNLKQIGLAFRTFGLDHEGVYPWRLSPQEGGTYGPAAGAGWKNYLAISNELASPRILVCPSDRGTRANALDWSSAPSGFINAANRNQALSYFMGLKRIYYTEAKNSLNCYGEYLQRIRKHSTC